jgi:two-component system, response regulator PdtaR
MTLRERRRLPAVRIASRLQGRPVAKPAVATDPLVPNQTVLVVEDEVLLRLVAADELRQQGCGVIEAASADEAMAVLRTGTKIDLVLTDIQLQGTLDGIGLARFVRSNLPRSKVIAVSGQLSAMRGNELFDAFFPKPYAMDHLVKCVRQLLDRHDEPFPNENNIASRRLD